MLQISLRLDIDKDLLNRWQWCNKTSYGHEWIEFLPSQYLILAEAFKGKDFSEVQCLKKDLEGIYEEKVKQIEYFIGEVNKILASHTELLINTLEKMTWRSIYTNQIILNLTTFPRCPYYKETNEIWIYVFSKPQSILGILLHELQHFMVIHYFKDRYPLNQLRDEQFEFIKESLTVILNSYPQLLFKKDQGYPLHQEFRSLLYQQREKNNNFEKLLEYACEQIISSWKEKV